MIKESRGIMKLHSHVKGLAFDLGQSRKASSIVNSRKRRARFRCKWAAGSGEALRQLMAIPSELFPIFR